MTAGHVAAEVEEILAVQGAVRQRIFGLVVKERLQLHPNPVGPPFKHRQFQVALQLPCHFNLEVVTHGDEHPVAVLPKSHRSVVKFGPTVKEGRFRVWLGIRRTNHLSIFPSRPPIHTDAIRPTLLHEHQRVLVRHGTIFRVV